MNIRSVAVFCGSHDGKNPLFLKHATDIGKLIATSNLQLVYGGGNKGLMGALANAVLAHKGKVTGIIPELLVAWESEHRGLTELSIVPDMHSRKLTIFEKSDAAIVLPGGFGTLDELFEMLTWNQLKIHNKKIFVLNTAGFYSHLASHILQLKTEGFLYDSPEERLVFCDTPEEIFDKIR